MKFDSTKNYLGLLLVSLFWAYVFHTADTNGMNSYLIWFIFAYFAVATGTLFKNKD